VGRAQIRPDIARLPAYKAGQRADPGGFKLSSNENPFGPLPSVLKVIAEAAAHINRYPDPHSQELVTAIAERFNVAPEWVAVGTGSVAVCQQIVSVVAGPGDEVVFAWPSFEAYPIVTGIAGATAVPVPLRADAAADVPAMTAAVTERTRAIFLCTPNNPTGTVVHHDDVCELLAAVPDDVLVVIDEAYVEFVDDPRAVRSLELLAAHENIAVLRTFSKAYGLAGLRVGFALAHAHTAEALRKTAIPFGVSGVAQRAAVASLADEPELLERVDHLRAERSRVVTGLRAAGWWVPEVQGNFIWLATAEQTQQVAEVLRAAGIIVRAFPGVGIRATIAEAAANGDLLAALAGGPEGTFTRLRTTLD